MVYEKDLTLEGPNFEVQTLRLSRGGYRITAKLVKEERNNKRTEESDVKRLNGHITAKPFSFSVNFCSTSGFVWKVAG